MNYEGIGRLVVVAAVAVLGLFKISKIEINPLKWLGKNISAAVTREISGKFETLDNKFAALQADVTDIRNQQEEHSAKESRMRILRFGDELLHGDNHSKDHFDQILDDVNRYELYCDTHPLFINNMTKATIKKIKSEYDEKLENNTFL